MENVCSVMGCIKPVRARGLCSTHYARAIKTREIEKIYHDNRQKNCHIEDDGVLCGLEVYAFGVCHKHYHRFRRTGIFETELQLLRKNSLLKEGDILAIKKTWTEHQEYKRLWHETGIIQIAKRFGVTKQLIDQILKGKIYKRIIPEADK